jgi:hypothetical protein
VDTTGGARWQVDFGYDETALIYDWQVLKRVNDLWRRLSSLGARQQHRERYVKRRG